MQIFHSHLVIDACCILNFSASGYLLSILKSIPAQVIVTETVRSDELTTLQVIDDNQDEAVTQFEAAIKQGVIKIVDFETEDEFETFINYVSGLKDDGEAATFAVAFHHGWAIATDDKRATSFSQRELSHLQLLTTLDLIKYWAESTKPNSTQIAEALSAIHTKGRYKPNKEHPLWNWWNAVMQNR
ncbi:hypothetical protein [Phormidium tenue]|uniref:PIN domain-containing protein n=1 Tax=Phormidium tenue NIES-30 TaxID=549789 RepID=A0A1U7J600_9CYAN|nr:hypothetical protein [Phormidium tenue]MBD2232098.1 hypothetical protein [Phormidium tenue FACHB-1052]OKH48315.1 hypothetical protein NIES30_09770 [Phormidium tenue NIES-30]